VLNKTYALCFEMRASEAVHVLVEVHHLETVELIGHCLDLLFLAWLNHFDTRRIPFDVCTRCFLVLTTSFDCAAGDFSVVYVLDLMVAHGACCDFRSIHVGFWRELLNVVSAFKSMGRKAFYGSFSILASSSQLLLASISPMVIPCVGAVFTQAAWGECGVAHKKGQT
jgi:hypothetical protein